MIEHYKALLLSGVVVIAFGGILSKPDTFGLGRLPGDIHARAGRLAVPFPVGTTLFVSVLVTVLVAMVMHVG